MKLATPMGACLGNKVQCKSPTLVWITAVFWDAAVAGAAGVRTGGLAVVACPKLSTEEEMIKTAVQIRGRMISSYKRARTNTIVHKADGDFGAGCTCAFSQKVNRASECYGFVTQLLLRTSERE